MGLLLFLREAAQIQLSCKNERQITHFQEGSASLAAKFFKGFLGVLGSGDGGSPAGNQGQQWRMASQKSRDWSSWSVDG